MVDPRLPRKQPPVVPTDIRTPGGLVLPGQAPPPPDSLVGRAMQQQQEMDARAIQMQFMELVTRERRSFEQATIAWVSTITVPENVVGIQMQRGDQFGLVLLLKDGRVYKLSCIVTGELLNPPAEESHEENAAPPPDAR